MKKFNAMILIVSVLGLVVSANATTYYSTDFSTNPGWTTDVTSGSSVTYSSSGYETIYSSNKTSHAVAATPTISGQGTEYSVTVRFTARDFGVVGSTNPDNQMYLLMPMANGDTTLQGEDSYSRDMAPSLLFGTADNATTVKFRIRCKLAGSVSNWSYATFDFLTFGTAYEFRYDRYDDYMNAYFREVGDDWTQLTYVNATTLETEDKFYFIGGHTADKTFDYLTTGVTDNVSRYKVEISSLSVTSVVPEPATLCLVLSGFAGVILKKRR